ncbi:ribose-5-phosphate isomerase [Pseudoalteromonas sp. S3776]|uniref:ribose-5-phosphate isomerase n=1 Tax=Pseudoalteromonas sp. S3776 TaxID=579544 RepID=UPI0011098F2B|nr:ribose-5-phosphate isomerase [Pseudoalteromonas sp. S3776]TMO79293.1 ribose-5-phosphate isomerase [Pseudoalteromonas sp. S3776]
MKYGLIMLALLSSSVFAKSELSVCESHKSKYKVEACINQAIAEKKRDLRVAMADINAVVVGQEEYGVSPGLSKEFSVNNKNYKAYLDSFCSLYLGATGANMGTGSVIASMKCEYIMLDHRIKALNFIKQ